MEQILNLIIELRDDYGVLPLVLTGGAIIGVLFGICAERSDFCSRTALLSLMDGSYRAAPVPVLTILIAMLVALIGTQTAAILGLSTLDEAVHHETELRIGGIYLGAALFGAGMILARGCVSRMLVLSARGNIRAVITITFLTLIAWASISGIFATPRIALAGFGAISLPLNHGTSAAFITALPLLALLVLWRGGLRALSVGQWASSIVIGLLVLAGFLVTGLIGADDFDPVPVEGLRFLQPVTESLAWFVYGSALPLKFGLSLVIGTLIGAGLSAQIGRRAALQGFDGAPHPARYLAGASLMGFGGVVSGGCTIGWLLNNAATAHLGVFIAIAGYVTAYKLLSFTKWAALRPSNLA